MADTRSPVYGPIPDAAAADPNGVPGQTKGGVPDLQAHQPTRSRLPTSGATRLVPPFLAHPHRDPLDTVGAGIEPPAV